MEKDGLIIEYLVLSVGQACNLKCRDCGNFSPILPIDTKFYDQSAVTNGLDIIAQNCERIRTLQIQGGEPFLYNQLVELLDFIGENEKFEWVQIATNGTICPDKRILELIQKYGIEIRISNYDVSNSVTDKLKKSVKKWQ